MINTIVICVSPYLPPTRKYAFRAPPHSTHCVLWSASKTDNPGGLCRSVWQIYHLSFYWGQAIIITWSQSDWCPIVLWLKPTGSERWIGPWEHGTSLSRGNWCEEKVTFMLSLRCRYEHDSRECSHWRNRVAWAAPLTALSGSHRLHSLRHSPHLIWSATTKPG